MSDDQRRFMFMAHEIAFRAADHGRYSLYERLKRLFESRFPDATHVQHEIAMSRLAELAGG